MRGKLHPVPGCLRIDCPPEGTIFGFRRLQLLVYKCAYFGNYNVQVLQLWQASLLAKCMCALKVSVGTSKFSKKSRTDVGLLL
jgi:hypothetical protein